MVSNVRRFANGLNERGKRNNNFFGRKLLFVDVENSVLLFSFSERKIPSDSSENGKFSWSSNFETSNTISSTHHFFRNGIGLRKNWIFGTELRILIQSEKCLKRSFNWLPLSGAPFVRATFSNSLGLLVNCFCFLFILILCRFVLQLAGPLVNRVRSSVACKYLVVSRDAWLLVESSSLLSPHTTDFSTRRIRTFHRCCTLFAIWEERSEKKIDAEQTRWGSYFY